ncbi:hypothetical protein KBD20_01335 [Candidatus Saccharibacteria bacterium]|nr:hypothetical protein [Candidatus Saccharibacteria bacterium]
MSKRKKWGLFLLLFPIIALPVVFVLQLLNRMAFSEIAAVTLVINLITLIVGSVAIFGFLPMVIIGIVLLSTPGKGNTETLALNQAQPLDNTAVYTQAQPVQNEVVEPGPVDSAGPPQYPPQV